MDGYKPLRKPWLHERIARWCVKLRLRYAMLVVKWMLGDKRIPPIERAHMIELFERDGELWLRIVMGESEGE